MKGSTKDHKCAETTTECPLGLWEIGGSTQTGKISQKKKKKVLWTKRPKVWPLRPVFSYLEMYPKDIIRNMHRGVQCDTV